MKLYHGSKSNLMSIRKSQAGKADNIDVPENELLDAIYLTPDYDFALACAIKPKGVNSINNENKSITFENPELFDPERTVFVYEANIKNIPEEKILKVDKYQYAIINTAEVGISSKTTHKAREIQNYYELKNWKEKPKENGSEFKMR